MKKYFKFIALELLNIFVVIFIVGFSYTMSVEILNYFFPPLAFDTFMPNKENILFLWVSESIVHGLIAGVLIAIYLFVFKLRCLSITLVLGLLLIFRLYYTFEITFSWIILRSVIFLSLSAVSIISFCYLRTILNNYNPPLDSRS